MTHSIRFSAAPLTGLAFSLLSMTAACVGATDAPPPACDDCDGALPPTPATPDRPPALDVGPAPRLDVSLGRGEAGARLDATLDAPRFRVRRGTEASLEVRVDRRGFEGEVAVWVEGLPAGIVADATVLAGTEHAGRLAVVATESAPLGGPHSFRVLVAAVCDADPVELPTTIVDAGFPGRLDPSFGTDGFVDVDSRFAVELDEVAVDTSGRVVVAGRVSDGLLFQRFDASGALDESFGADAAAIVPADLPLGASRMVLVGDEARVLMLAGRSDEGDAQVGLAAFDADGRLDETIRGNGLVPVLSLGSADVRSFALAAGDGSVFFRVDGRLAALRADGSVDELSLPEGSRDSLSMAHGAHALTFGVVDADPAGPAMLERVLASGGRDERFGERGVLRGPAESTDVVRSETVEVALRGDGSGYAATNRWRGERFTSGEVVRFTADGALDPTFGANGRVAFDAAGEHVIGMELDARGGVLVLTEQWPSFERRLRRYSAAGELDREFGLEGAIELGAIGLSDAAALAWDSVAERLLTCGPTRTGWRCARFWL